MNFKSFLIVTLGAIVLLQPLAAVPAVDRLQPARDFLKLDDATAKKTMETMPKEEAKALASQIIQLSKTRNPEILKLHYVLEHLASISANELGQTRLNNLLLVILLTVCLFSGFLIFVFLDQRRVIAQLLAVGNVDGLDIAAENMTLPADQGRLTSRKKGSPNTRKARRKGK